ncbi:MAG: M16 family metallopeptidase [Gemmatimonadota bacterium]
MANPTDTTGQVLLPFREHVLDNGLRVILHEDPSAPIVAVHVMYHVGSKDERPGRTGFAHLFEHLLFQGSEHVPRDGHFRYLQDAGGVLNGSTWFDRTNYFETVPANELDLALWLESDRMGFFKPGITQEKLDNQREVVKNERRQSYENRPYGLAWEALLELAYPEAHPYRHPTIGYMEDLDRASLDDVRDFFDRYYPPNNATLVLCGDIDSAEALERVVRWFGEIPPRPVPPPPEVPAQAPGPGTRCVIEDRVQVPRAYLMFHAPSFGDPGFEAAATVTALLAEGKSSRLHRELVYRRRIAADVSCFVWPLEKVGMMFVVATARPGVSAADLEAGIAETLSALLGEGVGERELEGALNRARRALVEGVNSVTNRADAFAHAAVLRDDPAYVSRAFERYASLTRDEVNGLARTLLGSDPNVLHVVPADDSADPETAP